MNPQINAIDFNERPFIDIWEVTQACDLACVHCRASEQPDPRSLIEVRGLPLIHDKTVGTGAQLLMAQEYPMTGPPARF
jgi:MoaA/NifB/PqqE/SkfB family radical SAM enzyme